MNIFLTFRRIVGLNDSWNNPCRMLAEMNGAVPRANCVFIYFFFPREFRTIDDPCSYSNEANISIIPTDSIIGMGAKGEKKELFFFFIRFPRIVALEIS